MHFTNNLCCTIVAYKKRPLNAFLKCEKHYIVTGEKRATLNAILMGLAYKLPNKTYIRRYKKITDLTTN